MIQCSLGRDCSGVEWYHKGCVNIQDNQTLPGRKLTMHNKNKISGKNQNVKASIIVNKQTKNCI